MSSSRDHAVAPPITNGGMEEDIDELKQQLQKENQEYLEQSKYFSEQLVALQSKMEDLRLQEHEEDEGEEEEEEEEEEDVREEVKLVGGGRLLRGEHLHASVVRQSSHKYSAREKVSTSFHHYHNYTITSISFPQSKSGTTKSRIAFFEEL